MKDFKNKVVVITGGATGIGKAMADRFGEVAIWAGLTFSLRGDETGLMLCVIGLAFSLLTPYVRSKAESWGAEGRGGWMGRAERMILLLAGLFFAGLGLKILHPMLWAFVIVTLFVFRR